MELRTIAILLLMASIVLITSAFGTYQDGIEKEKERSGSGHASEKAQQQRKELVGAAGAGTSYKQSSAHLDVSEKVDGPYVKEGPNTYRGKAGGYDLRDTYNSDDERDDGDSDSDSDDDENNGKPPTEFQRKIKYIKTIFKEIFSKWKSQEPIMAPTSIEEDLSAIDVEGFKIREKFKRGARQGMRKLRNAFRGRRNS
jgi:hypothetical protein